MAKWTYEGPDNPEQKKTVLIHPSPDTHTYIYLHSTTPLGAAVPHSGEDKAQLLRSNTVDFELVPFSIPHTFIVNYGRIWGVKASAGQGQTPPTF